MKVALITGASKGIGRAVAEGLAADGFSLALTARSKDRLQELKQGLLEKSAGTGCDIKVETYDLDIRDKSAVEAMVNDVVEKFGRIDLLFNNAGIFHGGTLDVSYEEFCEMLDINLKAAFLMLRLVVPVMRKQKQGTVINLSSRSGVIAKPRSGGYAASKFGLVGLSEAVYRDAIEDGVKVTALCPGWVDTDMAVMSGLPSEEMIQTADIVETVRWLYRLSPSACVNKVMIESIRQVV